jgi:FMN phosphatase YigB (HAD superfamily)
LHSANGFRAILFDMDGTLRHNRPHFAQAFFDIAASLGAPPTAEAFSNAARWLHYYWAKSEELVADRAVFGEDLVGFWTNHARLMLVTLGCPLEQAVELAPLAYQRMNDDYHPQDWVSPDVPPTLGALRDAGYHLAVLSNRSQPYQEQLESLGLAPYFEFFFLAGAMDTWKPDPQVFLKSIQQMGLQPGQAVYMGDNYYADVLGSRRAGLTPVLLDPDSLFPEADCAILRKLGELPELLAHHKAIASRV